MDTAIPSGRYARRVYYLVVVLLLAALLPIRFLLVPVLWNDPIPSFHDVLDAFLEDLFVGVLAATTLGTLLLFLLPRPRQDAVMEIVPPHERGDALDDARRDTDIWWFSGAMGRHTRAKTIPFLASRARQTNSPKTIVLQQLDPRSERACRQYAEYRSGLRTGKDDGSWNPTHVKRELFASIVSAYAWMNDEPLLDITVGLKDMVGVFRFDVAQRALVITKEDPLEPALRCPDTSFFYGAFLQELRLSLKQAHVLPKDVSGVALADVDGESARGLLTELGIFVGLTQEDLSAIARLVTEQKDPYG